MKIFDRIGLPGSRLRQAAGIAISCLILLALAAGSTMAYMSDTENSTENIVTAGTLDLVCMVSGSYTGGPPGLYQVAPGGNGINGNVLFDVMAPDQYGTIKWVLYNTGSLAGTLTVSISGTFTDGPPPQTPESLYDGLGGLPENNTVYGELGEYVMVTLQKGTGSSQAGAESALATGYINPGNDSDDANTFALGELGSLWNGDETLMTASGGSSGYVVYLFSWYLTAEKLGPALYEHINIVQGDTAQLDLTFTLSQLN